MKISFARLFPVCGTAMCRLVVTVAALAGAMAAHPARAQTLFDPVLLVDARPVTAFEFDQRVRFLRVLGMQGNLGAEVQDALIEERLQLAEAERLGVRLTPEDLAGGLEEFAARANLGVDAFVSAIAEAGVAPETFRDFVRAGLVWRSVVRARFGRMISDISEAEIDRELSTLRQRAGTMVSLSEIVLPATALQEATQLAQTLQGPNAFAEAARTRSIAPSASRGGRLGPVPVAYLGAQTGGALVGLPDGAISPPLRVSEGIVIYYKHGADRFATVSAQLTEVEAILIAAPDAGDAALTAAAAQLRGQFLECSTYQNGAAVQVAALLPGAVATRLRGPVADLPAGIAAAVAGLDAAEIAAVTRPAQGAGRGVVMLCDRRLVLGLPTGLGKAEGETADRTRAAVRDAIINRRLNDIATQYLADLRAAAQITRP